MIDYNNKTILLGVLVIVLFSILYFNFKSGKKNNFSVVQDNQDFFSLIDTIKNKQQYILSSFDVENDPFYFKSKVIEPQKQEEVINLPPMTLNGIIYNPSAPLVIINGETYGRGSKVKGAEIVSIFQNRVVLMYKNKEFILKLKE